MIERVLRERLSSTELDRHGLGAGMGVALITPRFPTSRHVVAMVHPSGGDQPRLVVKVPRRPGDDSGVRKEARMLEQLATAAPVAPRGVPEVVGLFEEKGYAVLVETAVTGAPLDPAYVQRCFAGAVSAGLAFISSLPETTAAADDRGAFERKIADPLRLFAEQMPLGGFGGDLVARTLSFLEPMRTASLPAVFQHGDLSHPNLFVRPDGGLQVVDWERATSQGLPGHDLVFYLAYLGESRAAAFTRPEQLSAFDQTFTVSRAWGRETLRTHLESRRVPAALLPQILVATWALTAATLVERLVPAPTENERLPAPLARPEQGDLEAVAMKDRDFMLWCHSLSVAERVA